MAKRRAASTETLTLFTNPINWSPPHDDRPESYLPAQMVVEVTSPHFPTLREERFESTPFGRMLYWDLTLPTPAALKFREFFRRTRTYDVDPVWFECHSLPPYVWGAEDEILPLPRQEHVETLGAPVGHDALAEGQPYVLSDFSMRGLHRVLGIRSEIFGAVNISVLGGNGPVAITRTKELCQSLGAEVIRPVHYENADMAAQLAGGELLRTGG